MEPQHPQCGWKVGVVDFPRKPEEQCTHAGRHRYWKWPDIPTCCLHLDAIDEVVRLANVISEESRWKWGEDARARLQNVLKLGTQGENRQSEWAKNRGLKATGSPIDEP